jgi:hypothetical protein
LGGNEEWKTKPVVVLSATCHLPYAIYHLPSARTNQMIHHEVHRNPKHIPVIACVSVYRESNILSISSILRFWIFLQSLEEKWRSHHCRFCYEIKADIMYQYQSFKDDIPHIVFPYFNKFRPNWEFANQEAILLIDNWPNHVVEKILDHLSQAHVHVIIIFISIWCTFSKSLFWHYLISSEGEDNIIFILYIKKR